MKPIILGMNVLRPFYMEHDDEWALIADYSETEEYDALDELFRYLTGDIPKSELPRGMCSKSNKELRKLYEKRFTVLYGKVLLGVGKDLIKGEIVLNIEFGKRKPKNAKEQIYIFPSDSFHHDEAHKWVHDPHYTPQLKTLINEGRVKVYSIQEFTEACNNRDISDMFEYWLVPNKVEVK